MARPLIAGNWKMNGSADSLTEISRLSAAFEERAPPCRVAICPPATLLVQAVERASGTMVEIGAQDCRAEASGAFTGDISAQMIADAGARLVILGHSERRTLHGETDEVVRGKVQGALRAGLEPIVCVGESIDERRAGRAVDVVRGQIRGSLPPELAGAAFSVAYEPVWAIGSGMTPTTAQIAEIHQAIREDLRELFGPAGDGPPILYGGSVKPDNAAQVLATAGVGGALVGGASLKAADFLKIIEAL
ncbi:MAG TPA: triose-phosphate isomerase [Caulobacteraceae bacterium]|nr:triose-phosphate isomerase [Caulobacteraceae bacterium]